MATVLPPMYLNDGLREVMIYRNWCGGLTNLAFCAAVAVAFFAIATRGMSWKER